MVANISPTSVELSVGDNRQATDQIISFDVIRALNNPAICEVSLAYDTTSRDLALVPGARFELRWGMANDIVFSGLLTRWTREMTTQGAHILRLSGQDTLHQLRNSQKPRVFVDQTIPEIMTSVLADHKLKVETQAKGPTFPRVFQVNQNDLEFLRDIAERAGMYFFQDARTVHIFDGKPIGLPTEVDLRTDVISYEMHEDFVISGGKHKVRGWSPSDFSVSTAVATRQPNSGAKDLADTQRHTSNARSWSHAMTEDKARRSMCRALNQESWLEFTIAGAPSVALGGALHLSGLTPQPYIDNGVSQIVFSASTTHGAKTHVSTRMPEWGGLVQGCDVTPARVTEIDDPSSLGRIKVSFPVFGDLSSDWLQVLTPAAGPDKGIIALPDKDDLVLVLFWGADPSTGLVLGSAFGDRKQSDTGIVRGKRRKLLFVAPGGQKFELDSHDGSVTLDTNAGTKIQMSKEEAVMTTSNGSEIRMTGSETVLNSKTNMRIEAPGKKLTIAASRINFEKD